jgi:hypothetical protein
MGGTNVAIDWPNMCDNGSRFRNRIGANGFAYFRYFAISPSMGTMLARMFRWVMTTPLGSAVAPEVKMISAVSSPLVSSRGDERRQRASRGGGRPQLGEPPDGRAGAVPRAERRDVRRVAGEDGPRLDDSRHALEEIG